MKTHKPVHGTARLFVAINGQTYSLRFLESHPEIGAPAWRLQKIMETETGSPSEYDVILSKTGPLCSCPDFEYRRINTGQSCKHVAALKAVGILRKDFP